MNKDTFLTLQVLEEIEGGGSTTQRALSRRLGVALGLTNALVRRLAKKGYIEIASIDRRRMKYVLTPKGLAEKSRLTYHYLQHSINFYVTAREKVREGLRVLEKEGVRSIVFYGAGDVAEIVYLSLHGTRLELTGVVDDSRVGGTFFGFPIFNRDELHKLELDRIVIASFNNAPMMYEKLKAQGFDDSMIFLFEDIPFWKES